MGFRDLLALKNLKERLAKRTLQNLQKNVESIPNDAFKEAAKAALTAKEKFKIPAPQHDEMKKQFMAGYEDWKKAHPEGSDWDYAREFMAGKIHDKS